MERLFIEILMIMIIGSVAFVVGAVMGAGSQREDQEEMLLNKENPQMHKLIKHRI
jgi:hypothetical protein